MGTKIIPNRIRIESIFLVRIGKTPPARLLNISSDLTIFYYITDISKMPYCFPAASMQSVEFKRFDDYWMGRNTIKPQFRTGNSHSFGTAASSDFECDVHPVNDEYKRNDHNHMYLYYFRFIFARMLLATLIPFAEACCKPLVIPAPSPIARKPSTLVSKSSFTTTLLE